MHTVVLYNHVIINPKMCRSAVECILLLIISMLKRYEFRLHTVFSMQCAVSENIHTPPTEGIGISWGLGVPLKTKTFKEMYQA